jgi:hypothetical protein
MVGKMSDLDHTEPCDFCREGHVITRNRKIAFRQWTNRGYIHCHAEIPIGLCDFCGWKHWNQEAEAIINEVVRRQYDKLPRSG